MPMSPHYAPPPALPEHSEHGASSCKRWWTCPGSVDLSRGIPDETSVYAAEGTAAHELAALCLASGQDAIEYTGRTVAGFNVDADMAEAVQVYLDHCRVILRTSADVVHHIEHRFTLASLDPPAPMYGTADFVASYGGWLWVVDLKYGQGVQVEAEGNPQLKYYALGALIDNPAARYITASIVQPRAPGGPAIRTADLDPVELVEWSVELMGRARATLEPGAALVPGEWCRSTFCKARGVCTAQRDAAMAVAGSEFVTLPEGWTGKPCERCEATGQDVNPSTGEYRVCIGCGGTGEGYGILSGPALPDPRLMTPEQVSTSLGMADMLDGFLRDLRAAATAELSRGGVIPGWKLVPTRPSQSWRDAEETDAALEDLHGFGDERFAPRKLISPAAARGIIAARLPGSKKSATEAARAALADLIVTASSGVNLAPDADSRLALPAAGSEFLALPDHTTEESHA